jgi:hypothetical protein
MGCKLCIVVVVATAGLRIARADETWRVEITQHESETVTEAPPKDPANTKLERKTTSTFKIASTEPASAAGGMVAIAPRTPHLETLEGAYSQTEATSAKSPYGSSSTNSEINGSVDRSSATYKFGYRDDAHWELEAEVAFKAGTRTRTCSEDVVMHQPKHCDDLTGDTIVSSVLALTPDTAKLTKIKGGLLIQWSPDEQTQDATEGRKVLHHVDASATIVRKTRGDQKYEAVLMPETPAQYRLWEPKGPPVDGPDPDAAGNTLGVVLEIRDHKTHKPVAAGYTVTYTIDGSRFPGFAMNAPKASPNTKSDLFFDPAQNAGHDVHDERNMVRSHATGRDTIIVSSRDYGAVARSAPRSSSTTANSRSSRPTRAST